MSTPIPDPQLSPPAVVGNSIVLPVTTDPDVLTAEGFAYLQAAQPGWVPHEGQLDVAMVEVFARMVASAARIAATVPLSIFQYLGQQLHNIPPLAGATATMDVKFTFVDDLGHTIPSGTQVLLPVSPGQSFLFVTTTAVTAAPATLAATVTMSAAQVGGASNGVPATRLVLVDALAWVETVTCTDIPAAPSGGADAETVPVYLARLRRELSLLTPRPILPGDFATIALDQVGVARAVALDGYNPANGTTGNSLTVAVAAVDAGGQPLSASAATALQTALNATRGVNWQVLLTSPTYTAVNISAQIIVKRGQSLNTVQAAAQLAATNYISPRFWGGSVDDQGLPTADWTNTTTVRLLGVVGALIGVPGVSWVQGVQLSAGNGALAAQDVQLTGTIPMATPGTVSVVANYT